MQNKKLFNKALSISLLCVVIFILFIYKSFINFRNNLAIFSPNIHISVFSDYSQNKAKALKNKVDIIAIGNSDLYSAVNPLQLWSEYGYTSYLCSYPKQNMALSYFCLNEILIPQRPKLIILEVDNFFENRGNDKLESYLTDIYKLAKPLYKNSFMWNKVKDIPIHKRSYLNGYFYNTNTIPYYGDFSYLYTNSNLPSKVSKHTTKYFPKIIEISKTYNIPLLLLSVPSANTWSYKKHDIVQKYADKYNIPFLDLNIEEGFRNYGFNWITDTRDGGNHLNYFGATKLTSYLGAYLKNNYSIPDHSLDPTFYEWNIQYENFLYSSYHN